MATGDMVEHLIAGLCKVAYGYMDDILLHGDGCKTEQRGSMAVRKYYPDEIKCPLKA